MDLWTFVALHGTFGLINFTLLQFELAQSNELRPYKSIASSVPVVFVYVFLIYPLGQSGWFFALPLVYQLYFHSSFRNQMHDAIRKLAN